MVWRLPCASWGALRGPCSRLNGCRTPALRRRANAGLNKGEARNALARSVFFNRLGKIRDRSFENQRYRASGLNLVLAAIALWNTVYLERAILALRQSTAGPEWVEPTKIHCLMVFDTQSNQFVGSGCYVVAALPAAEQLVKLETVTAEFVGGTGVL
jgi:Tn3 transposase DDE domain-containing protein